MQKIINIDLNENQLRLYQYVVKYQGPCYVQDDDRRDVATLQSMGLVRGVYGWESGQLEYYYINTEMPPNMLSAKKIRELSAKHEAESDKLINNTLEKIRASKEHMKKNDLNISIWYEPGPHGVAGYYWDITEDSGGDDRLSPNGPHMAASLAENDASVTFGPKTNLIFEYGKPNHYNY